MTILVDYEIVGRTILKCINGTFDTWTVVDYLGENAYLVKGEIYGYKLVVRDQLRELF